MNQAQERFTYSMQQHSKLAHPSKTPKQIMMEELGLAGERELAVHV